MEALFPECGDCDEAGVVHGVSTYCLDGSGICGANGLCPSAQACGNDERDGDETGIDCGGLLCAPCAAYQPCERASDCLSTSCAQNPLYCGSGSCCAETDDGFYDEES